MSVIFKDERSRAVIEAAYERFRARIPGAEGRVVPTRAGDTHVLSAGPEGAPTIVLFHGALASSAHVLGEMGPLRDRFRVHAVDVIGQSVKSADVRVDLDGPAYADWASDVLDALGLSKSHVYGVSWGGFVARKLAEHAPSRVDRLILMVPAGFVNGPFWEGLTELMIPMTLYRAFPSDARLRRFTAALLSTPDEEWIQYLGEAFRHYRMDMRVPPLAGAETLRGFTRPTLVFGADGDLTFPGEALAARVKALIPHAEIEMIEGSRHSPPTDDAFRARMADRVTRFLQSA